MLPTSPSRKLSEHTVQSGSGKKITRLMGATESSSHSLDQDELEQFAAHLNGIARKDKDLSGRDNIDVDNFFASCQDGLLLSKLILDTILSGKFSGLEMILPPVS